jgi:hypothetical protein
MAPSATAITICSLGSVDFAYPRSKRIAHILAGEVVRGRRDLAREIRDGPLQRAASEAAVEPAILRMRTAFRRSWTTRAPSLFTRIRATARPRAPTTRIMKRLPAQPLASYETGGKNLFESECDDDALEIELDHERSSQPLARGHSYIRTSEAAPPPASAHEDPLAEWTDLHLSLYATLAAIESSLARAPQHPAAGPSIELVRHFSESLRRVSEALHALLVDALGAASLTADGSRLVVIVRALYAWAHSIADAARQLAAELELLQPDWPGFAEAIRRRKWGLSAGAVLRACDAIRADGVHTEPDAVTDDATSAWLAAIDAHVDRAMVSALWLELELRSSFAVDRSAHGRAR